jgi:hypothetical protein
MAPLEIALILGCFAYVYDELRAHLALVDRGPQPRLLLRQYHTTKSFFWVCL